MGTVTNAAQSSLRFKELSLGAPSGELATRQHHRGVGDPLSAGCGERVLDGTVRAVERASGLLESAFGVLGVLPGFEVSETSLNLGGSHVKPPVSQHVQGRTDSQEANEDHAREGSATDT